MHRICTTYAEKCVCPFVYRGPTNLCFVCDFVFHRPQQLSRNGLGRAVLRFHMTSLAPNPFTDPQAPTRTSAFRKAEPPAPKMLKGKPLGSQLLVRKIEFVDAGLIHTPQSAIRDTGEVVVLAIGPAVKEIKVGDHLMVRKYSGAGTEVTHDGSTFLVLDSNEVLLVLDAS